jgi:hypothetical protein
MIHALVGAGKNISNATVYSRLAAREQMLTHNVLNINMLARICNPGFLILRLVPNGYGHGLQIRASNNPGRIIGK